MIIFTAWSRIMPFLIETAHISKNTFNLKKIYVIYTTSLDSFKVGPHSHIETCIYQIYTCLLVIQFKHSCTNGFTLFFVRNVHNRVLSALFDFNPLKLIYCEI